MKNSILTIALLLSVSSFASNGGVEVKKSERKIVVEGVIYTEVIGLTGVTATDLKKGDYVTVNKTTSSFAWSKAGIIAFISLDKRWVKLDNGKFVKISHINTINK